MRLLYSHLTAGRDVFTDAARCMKIPGLHGAQVWQCHQVSVQLSGRGVSLNPTYTFSV